MTVSGAGATIELRLFGGVEMRGTASSPSSDFLARSKQLGFVAYTAVAKPDLFYRRDALLVMFWPELDTEHARASLRNTLSRVRTALGPDVIETRGLEELRIRPGSIWCDVNEFRAAIADRDYENALRLYRGDLLEGFHVSAAAEFEHWLTTTRQELRRAAAEAARELSTHAVADGDVSAALAWARRRLQIDPDDEEALRDFMHASEESGDRAGALRAFQETERRLSDAYGLQLSPATKQFADELRLAREDMPPLAPPRSSPGVEASASEPSAPRSGAPAWRRSPSRAAVALALVVAGAIVAAAVVVAGRMSSPGAQPDHASRWVSAPLIGAPSARAAASLVYDSRRNEGVLFGGRAAETVLGDVWRLHDAFANPRWERIATTDVGPGVRWLHGSVYDPASDRMIVFGGSSGYTTPCSNDVWILPGAMRGQPPLTWIKLDVGNGPAPRAEAGVAYDAARNRLIVHGGHNCVAPIYDDLWILTNANGIGRADWRHIRTLAGAPSPGPLRNHTLVHDPISDRLILYGGRSGYARDYSDLKTDLWTVRGLEHSSLGWRKVEVGGNGPPPIEFHLAFHDPATNRLLVLGGMSPQETANVQISEVWLARGVNGVSGRTVWHRLPVTDGPRVTSFVGAYDPEANRVLIFGGYTTNQALADAYFLDNAMSR